MSLIIETCGLSKSFKGKKKTVIEVVQKLDLAVKTGEIFGFLGPNGAGKSTTMRMLTTLLTPTSGQATVAGHDLIKEQNKVRERIGYVSQAGGSDPNANARENLILQGRLYGMTKADAATRANELIEAVELEQCADRPARTYSGGQRRRLDLALGMVHKPELLFMDEPTTALDPQSRARLWDELRKLRETGTTIFVTTHYLDEADALCDRLAIMDGGKIVAEGTPTTLKRQIAGDIVTIGLGYRDGRFERAQELLRAQPYVLDLFNDADIVKLHVESGERALPSIMRMLDREGLPVATIALARPSLDDVFLQQTGRSLRESKN
jgi:ABC-2 type transport system ATP-binding protein